MSDLDIYHKAKIFSVADMHLLSYLPVPEHWDRLCLQVYRSVKPRPDVLMWCGGPVCSSSTVIPQTLPKNCVEESPRVIVKWFLALVTLLIVWSYVIH